MIRLSGIGFIHGCSAAAIGTSQRRVCAGLQHSRRILINFDFLEEDGPNRRSDLADVGVASGCFKFKGSPGGVILIVQLGNRFKPLVVYLCFAFCMGMLVAVCNGKDKFRIR